MNARSVFDHVLCMHVCVCVARVASRRVLRSVCLHAFVVLTEQSTTVTPTLKTAPPMTTFCRESVDRQSSLASSSRYQRSNCDKCARRAWKQMAPLYSSARGSGERTTITSRCAANARIVQSQGGRGRYRRLMAWTDCRRQSLHQAELRGLRAE